MAINSYITAKMLTVPQDMSCWHLSVLWLQFAVKFGPAIIVFSDTSGSRTESLCVSVSCTVLQCSTHSALVVCQLFSCQQCCVLAERGKQLMLLVVLSVYGKWSGWRDCRWVHRGRSTGPLVGTSLVGAYFVDNNVSTVHRHWQQ